MTDSNGGFGPLNTSHMETPPHILEVLRNKGYEPVLKAIRLSCVDMWRSGYNWKEIHNTLIREFGITDPRIKDEIQRVTFECR